MEMVKRRGKKMGTAKKEKEKIKKRKLLTENKGRLSAVKTADKRMFCGVIGDVDAEDIHFRSGSSVIIALDEVIEVVILKKVDDIAGIMNFLLELVENRVNESKEEEKRAFSIFLAEGDKRLAKMKEDRF